ncbi:MAG: hypothetical protein LIP03_15080 [Bacteroidales bacterium]|nr:hypothetical protein [Bacteroidales bacterium]
MKRCIYILLAVIAASLASCIEDGFTTSPSDQPAFSADTLDLGTVYTAERAITTRMAVYNRHSKGLNLQRVALSGADASLFRLNVDGMGGTEFTDIEIRANDSIYVFVDCLLPENGSDEPQAITASIDFTTNGVVSSVIVAVRGQDINRIQGEVITADAFWRAGKPYQIKDSLIVSEGATLTIEAGAKLLFHDASYMRVNGTLVCMGQPGNPVRLTGDRTGEVIPGVSYDLMSRQWDGIDFMESSTGNYMQYTEVSNTSYGVGVYGDGSDVSEKKLTLINSVLRNSGECVLSALNASVEALGCEFAEASYGLIYLVGGDHRFDQCTVSNNYLYSAISGAAWTMIDPAETEEYYDAAPTKALITNTITYGLGSDVTPGDFTGWDVYFKRCLFKSAGTDDDNFIDCLWDEDPLFYTVRDEYLFDYRLKPDSPAIDAAYPALSENRLEDDFYGVKRTLELGAYSFVAQ